uniref:F5/8 type C domain-containing protein n=1 Tax=Stegastes partitus TaxID=144197 RepID=A0A3B5AGE3_9TELE
FPPDLRTSCPGRPASQTTIWTRTDLLLLVLSFSNPASMFPKVYRMKCRSPNLRLMLCLVLRLLTVCLHGLGVEDGNVTDTQLTASSSVGQFTPEKALQVFLAHWIQTDLGQLRKVTGIVMQGCPQSDYWLTKFKIQHSTDGTTWTDYTADGEVRKDQTLVTYSSKLSKPILKDFVRILPVQFNSQAGFRFDILGCSPDCKKTFY